MEIFLLLCKFGALNTMNATKLVVIVEYLSTNIEQKSRMQIWSSFLQLLLKFTFLTYPHTPPSLYPHIRFTWFYYRCIVVVVVGDIDTPSTSIGSYSVDTPVTARPGHIRYAAFINIWNTSNVVTEMAYSNCHYSVK